MGLFKKLIGWSLIITCTPFVIVAVSDLVLGSDTSTGVLLALLFMFGTGSLGGARLAFPKKRAAEKALPAGDTAEQEALLLRAVGHFGGTIGAAQLAAHMGMSFADAKASLQKLAQEGACRVIVDEEGAELFRFPDLALGPGGSAEARDLLAP